MSVAIQNELGLLNADLARYQEVTKKTPQEMLLKQGGKLAYALSHRLRFLMPAKGSIRSERLAGLKLGGGIKIRPAVQEMVMQKYGVRQTIDTRETIFGKRGVKSVLRKGKRLNLWALMAQREISLRESGRGFLGFSARFSGIGILKTVARQKWIDRFARTLAEAGLTVSQANGVLELAWQGGVSAQRAAEGLLKPKAQEAIAAAIRDVRQDVNEYLARKARENAAAAFRKN